MNIHEYQAKEIFKNYTLPVGNGYIAETVEDAQNAYDKLSSTLCVVKAQIHAGGRGKAGGVILCHSKDDVKKAAQKLLGHSLITHQTTSEGQIVRKIYIEEGSSIERELYLSFVLNRKKSMVTIIASAEGGVDIEEVAKTTPEKILNIPIHPSLGIMPYHVRLLSKAFLLNQQQSQELFSIIKNIFALIKEKDANLVEINPLIITKDSHLKILDAKVSFDDNALFKHTDIEALRDVYEENEYEIKARKEDLNYIKLNGDIGCMVNGAGLAMATMDIIQLHGGKPANFLDVGGGATKEKVQTAFQLILSDQDVKGIFVNIFGGIMRCDIIAQGIVDAAKNIQMHVPLVVRLQGTNASQGQEILNKSGLKIIAIDSLEKAAQTIVEQVSENIGK